MKAFRNTKEQLKRGLAVLLATAITAQMPMSYVQASETEIAAEEQTEEISVTATEELEEEEEILAETVGEDDTLLDDSARDDNIIGTESVEEAASGDMYVLNENQSAGTGNVDEEVMDDEWILGDSEVEEAEMAISLFSVETAPSEISVAGTYYLTDWFDGTTGTVSASKHIDITATDGTVKIVGNPEVVYKNLSLCVRENAMLEIENVNITGDAITLTYAEPTYKGITQIPIVLCSGSTLTVTGSNTLLSGGVMQKYGGVVTAYGENITINGSGSMDIKTQGGFWVSGIDVGMYTRKKNLPSSLTIGGSVNLNVRTVQSYAAAIGMSGENNNLAQVSLTIKDNAAVKAENAATNGVAIGGETHESPVNMNISIEGNAHVWAYNVGTAGSNDKPGLTGIGVVGAKANNSNMAIVIKENASVEGAGICAGLGENSSITVSGGTVTKTKYDILNARGTSNTTKQNNDGYGLFASKVTITGGVVNVIANKASAIAGDVIHITGGTIDATGYSGMAGIGMYAIDKPVEIIISGGNIIAKGANAAAGIGAINNATASEGNIISMIGGTVYALGGFNTMGNEGAGIGGGYKNVSGGTIEIGSSAVITSIGGKGTYGTSMSKGIGAGGGCSEDTTSLTIDKGARVMSFSPDKTKSSLAMPKCSPDASIGIWGQFESVLAAGTKLTVYFDDSVEGVEVEMPVAVSSFAFTTCSSVKLENEAGETIELPGTNTMDADGVYSSLEWKSAIPSLEDAALTISNVIENIELAFAGNKIFTYTITKLEGSVMNGEYDLSMLGADDQIAEITIAYQNGTAESESETVTLPAMLSGDTYYYLVRGSQTEEDASGIWSYDNPYLVTVSVVTDENQAAVGTITCRQGIISGTTFSILPGEEEKAASEITFVNIYEEYEDHGQHDIGNGDKELSERVHAVGAYTYLDTDAWYKQMEDAEGKYTLVHGHYDADNNLFYYIIPKKAYDKVVLDGTQYVECLIEKYTNSNWKEDPSPWNPGSMKNIPWCVINDSDSTYDYADCGFYLSDEGFDSNHAARYYLDEVEPRSTAATATAAGSGVADFRKVLRTASTPLQYLYGPVAGTDEEGPIASRTELSAAIVPVGIEQIYNAEAKVNEVYGGKYTYEQFILHFYNDILQAGEGAGSIAQLPLSCRMNLLGYAYNNGLGISEFPWNLFNIGNYTMSLNAYQTELIEQMKQAASVYESADMGTYRLYGMIEPSVEIQNMAYHSFYRDALKFTFDYERDSDLLKSSQSSFETAIYATEIMGWSTLCALTGDQAFRAENLNQPHTEPEQTAVDSIAETVGTISILGGNDVVFNGSLLSVQGLTTPNAYYGAAMMYGLGMDITLQTNRKEYDFSLVKKDEDGTQLGDAAFELFTNGDEALSFIITETDEAVIYTYTAEMEKGSTEEIVSAANKEVAVYGLPQGSYYLKEVRTPAQKYKLNDTVYKIEVTKEEKDTEQASERLVRVYKSYKDKEDEIIGYTQESQGKRAVIEVVNSLHTADTMLRIVKKVTSDTIAFAGTEEFSFVVSELETVTEKENSYKWESSVAFPEEFKIIYNSEEPENAFVSVELEKLKYGSVHYYLIQENDLNKAHWFCDAGVWLVKVAVGDDGSMRKFYIPGTMEGQTFTAKETDAKMEEAEFTNKFRTKKVAFIKVETGVADGKTLTGAVFIVKPETVSDHFKTRELTEITVNDTDKKDVLSSELVVGCTYRIVEVIAPQGYTICPDILFKVEYNGWLSIVTEPGKISSGMATNTETAEIRIADEPIEVAVVKADAADPKVRLEGAVFELKDSKGNVIQGASALTTDRNGEVKIPKLVLAQGGEYILTEIAAPNGYQLSDTGVSVRFSVNTDGTVTFSEGTDTSVFDGNGTAEIFVKNEKTKFAVDKVSNENPGVTLEGATLKLVKNDGTEVESWTTSAGEDGNTPRIFEGLAVGRYKLLEISAPKGYVTVTDELVFDLNADNTITVVGGFAEDQEEIVTVKNGVITITMTDPYIRGKVELVKTVRDVPLPGAVFELYEGTAPGGTLIAEVTTGEDGKWESASDSAVLKNGHEALTQGLTEGSYYFKEKSVPDNVYLDTGKVYPFTVDAASHDKVQTISVANVPFKAAMRLRKIDEQDQSPVSGASFKAVYSKTKEGLADSAEEISFASATDADGMAEITFTKKGFYKIVETVAEGYEADFAGIIEITNDDYGKTLDLTEEAVLGRLMNPDGLEGMPDNITAEGITNARKAGSVTITKADGGDHALLRGVVFKLQKKNADGEYEDIASLEGVETGKIYTVSQDTDGLTSVSVKDAQNADGLLKVEGLGWGKYRLSEVTPLPGYTLNKDAAWEFEVKRTDLDHTYWTDTVKTDDGEKRLVLNRENHLTVIKKDAKTGAVLAGAEFEVLDLNKEPLTPAVTMTTGEDGAVTVGGKTSKLVGGKQYYLHETKAPEGYELAEDVLFTMNTDGTVTWDDIKRENDTILVYDEPIEITIVKVDAADPKVRLEGAVFELKDSKGSIIPGAESLTTDHSGEVKIPKLVLGQGQSYTLTEIKAPEGYQIADVKPVISFCVEEDGRLSFTEDIVFEGTGGDIITVKNVKTGFCIDKISNEVAADGSEIRPEATLELVNVKTGSIVDTWTSGSIKVLEGLPAGEYKLTERVTPDGFVTAEAISFKLEENNRLTGVTTADQERITRNDDGYDTVTMVNEVIRGHVQIRKSLTNGIPLEGAVFSLYRQVGEMDVEGSTEAETDKDILIAQNLQTDERGIWTSVGNKEKRQDKTGQETLSFGLEKGIYYFKEMSVPEGVVLDSQSSWTFTIDEKDHGQVLTVDIENKTNIVNIKKVDKEQPEKVLAGVVFAVYEANTDGTFDLEKPVVTATTDSGGEISVEGLLGDGKTYVLHELKALEGYELADDITFVMEKNGAVKINGEIIKDNLIVVEDMPKREEPPETEATSETEEPSEPEESSETEEPTEDLTGTEEQTESEKNSVQDRSTPSGTAASPVNTADETDGIVWIVWMLISFLSLSGVGIRKKSKGRK